jgi:sec-independent protein translocase protein TatB
MRIGTSELIVVLIVALLVLGPEKLPFYAKKLGGALSTIKNYTNDFTREINENILEPISTIKEPLDNAAKPLSNLAEEIKAPFNEAKMSVEKIGHTDEESFQIKTTEKNAVDNV